MKVKTSKYGSLKIFRKVSVTLMIFSIVAAVAGPVLMIFIGLSNLNHSFAVGVMIDSEEKLSQLASDGDGSTDNPYVIRNYLFETPADFCMEIDYHIYSSFVIQNCKFKNFRRNGLYINSESNKISLIDNIFEGDEEALNLYIGVYSNDEVIEINIINNIFNAGINIDYWGTEVYYSIENNTMSMNGYDRSIKGMQVPYTNNTVIRGNSFYGCSLILDDSIRNPDLFQYTTIENNFVNDLPLEFFVSQSDLTLNLDEYGLLVLLNCSNIYFEPASIQNTGTAVSIIRSNNCTFENILFNNNHLALDIFESSKIDVQNCVFRDNSYGINIDKSQNINISNSFFQNRYQGISIYAYEDSAANVDSYTSTIIHSNIFLCHYYQLVLNDYNSIISNNHFEGSAWEAISAGGKNNTFFANVFLNNNAKYSIQVSDEGSGNRWSDDENQLGNSWSDYNGEGVYPIEGSANSQDNYPNIATQESLLGCIECLEPRNYHYKFLDNPLKVFFFVDGNVFVLSIIGVIVSSIMRKKNPLRIAEKQV